jgi:hypothetical protein
MDKLPVEILTKIIDCKSYRPRLLNFLPHTDLIPNAFGAF